jgi:UrcA family protein
MISFRTCTAALVAAPLLIATASAGTTSASVSLTGYDLTQPAGVAAAHAAIAKAARHACLDERLKTRQLSDLSQCESELTEALLEDLARQRVQ